MVVDTVIEFELDLSNYNNSTTTTTTTTTTTPNTSTTTTPLPDDRWWSNWNDWSPIDDLLVIDWDSLSGNHDNFHDVIESMMDNNNNNSEQQHDPEARVLSTTATIAVEEEEEEEMTGGIGDFKGLRLVHLLMAAAEALTGVNKSHELARVILVRLKDLASPTDGTNMERLAAHFTHALQGLLEGAGGKYMGSHHDLHQTDVLAAFQLLQDMSPYVKFGHFTANQAILEAVAQDKRVHVVDYDIMEGIQWASLMQALVSRKDGPPAPHLRITAISRGGASRRSIGTVQETGRRLIAFAASIGQSLTFHQCRLDSNETFRPSNLKLVRGEALVFNCMLYLSHFNYCASDSIASFLSGAKTLNPRLVTLAEEEVGPVGDGGFAGRFMDSLHHYSAVYDSLEAGFPMQSRARELVERVFLGPQISGSLARIYRESGEDESCSWGEWLGAVGFHPVNVSFANHCQAKLLLGLFNDGYKVEELANNRLVLRWKTRRLLSASVWTTSDSNL